MILPFYSISYAFVNSRVSTCTCARRYLWAEFPELPNYNRCVELLPRCAFSGLVRNAQKRMPIRTIENEHSISNPAGARKCWTRREGGWSSTVWLGQDGRCPGCQQPITKSNFGMFAIGWRTDAANNRQMHHRNRHKAHQHTGKHSGGTGPPKGAFIEAWTGWGELSNLVLRGNGAAMLHFYPTVWQQINQLN